MFFTGPGGACRTTFIAASRAASAFCLARFAAIALLALAPVTQSGLKVGAAKACRADDLARVMHRLGITSTRRGAKGRVVLQVSRPAPHDRTSRRRGGAEVVAWHGFNRIGAQCVDSLPDEAKSPSGTSV
jgi:hypothetical protein